MHSIEPARLGRRNMQARGGQFHSSIAQLLPVARVLAKSHSNAYKH